MKILSGDTDKTQTLIKIGKVNLINLGGLDRNQITFAKGNQLEES